MDTPSQRDRVCEPYKVQTAVIVAGVGTKIQLGRVLATDNNN
jgi:hypothetical protein